MTEESTSKITRGLSAKEIEERIEKAKLRAVQANANIKNLKASLKKKHTENMKKTTVYLGEAMLAELKRREDNAKEEGLSDEQKAHREKSLHSFQEFLVNMLDQHTKRAYKRKILAQTVPERFDQSTFVIDPNAEEVQPKTSDDPNHE